MWRNCNVDTRRRIRRFWRKKAPMLAGNPRRWNQATGPISATICSVLEAGWKPSSPGFWQSPDGSATLDGALFNKAQIIDSFSSDMEMQTWKAAARHSSSSGLEKGISTDFAKKARSQLIKEGSFTAARALDFLVCGAINEPHLPADGSIPNQFLCVRCDQKVQDKQESEHTSRHWYKNFGTQIKFCLPAVCCHVIGCLRTNSQNAMRPRCGKVSISPHAPVTMCCSPRTHQVEVGRLSKH